MASVVMWGCILPPSKGVDKTGDFSLARVLRAARDLGPFGIVDVIGEIRDGLSMGTLLLDATAFWKADVSFTDIFFGF